MTLGEEKGRPGDWAAPHKINTEVEVDGSTLADLDAMAEHINGALVVVVVTPAGRYRRRVFLTAAAAERAVRNAEARGHSAEVFLAELRPVHRVEGGDLR